jgi:hypothetical protein
MKAPSKPNKAGLYTRPSKRKPQQPGNKMFDPVAAGAMAMLKKNLVHQLKAALKRN